MKPSPQLKLICHPKWMADELSVNPSHEVEHSFGIEVPPYNKKDIWWMPQAAAVQLLNSIQHHQISPTPAFTAPSAGLVGQLDKRFTGRSTGVLEAHEAISVLVDWPAQFWKLATAKSDEFEAKPRTHDQLVHDVHAAQLPAKSLLEYNEELTGDRRIVKEFRTYIMDEEVLTGSIYLDLTNPELPVTVYDGAVASDEELNTALEFAEEVVEDPTSPNMPPAYVMDVALLADGSWIVLEFNPVWCSAWYDADIESVVLAIARSFKVTSVERKKWAYEPDPYLLAKYPHPLPLKPELPRA